MIGKFVRKIWHDVFYAVAGSWGDRLAKTCAAVTQKTDLHSGKRDISYWLHLSVCKACKNYYEFSIYLTRNFRDVEVQHIEIKNLNQRLAQFFSSKNT